MNYVGRSKVCFYHEGNNSVRMLIVEHVGMYSMTSTQELKMKVIELVVDVVVDRGGRFLLIQMTEGTWVDGGQKQDKAQPGHAMRDTFRRHPK